MVFTWKEISTDKSFLNVILFINAINFVYCLIIFYCVLYMFYCYASEYINVSINIKYYYLELKD
jgi:hypothetical protein